MKTNSPHIVIRAALTCAFVVITAAMTAGSLGIRVTPSTQSISLPHSTSHNVGATLSPANNSVCQLNCDYELQLKDEIREADYFKADPSTASQIGPISVRAPPRTEEYRRTGQRQYDLRVSCSEAPRCGDASQTTTTSINVDYNLSPDRHQRYRALRAAISSSKNAMDRLQAVIEDAKTILNDLPRTAPHSHLQARHDNITTAKREYTEQINEAQSNLEQLRYQFGLQVLGDNHVARINTTIDEAKALKRAVQRTANEHNQTIRAINTVAEAYNEVIESATRLGITEPITDAKTSYQALRSLFTNGEFQAYQTIHTRLSRVNTTVQALINKTAAETQRLTEQARNTIQQEINASCKPSPACNTTPPRLTGSIQTRLNTACEYLNQTLPTVYDEAHREAEQAYKDEQNTTQQRNHRINEVNDAIHTINKDINAAKNTSEKAYISINTTNCRQASATLHERIEANTIPSHTAITEATEACSTARQAAAEAANQSKTPWEYLTYLFSDMYTDYTVDIQRIPRMTTLNPPSEPAPIHVTEQTQSFITSHCDETTNAAPLKTLSPYQPPTN